MSETATITAETITGNIDANLTAYGQPDAAARDALLAGAWAADGHLIDPPLDGKGLDGITAMMAAVQGQFPGHTFRRTTGIDVHHSTARYGWELVGPDGAAVLAGLDVADVDTDGKLTRVVGFFGDLPAAG